MNKKTTHRIPSKRVARQQRIARRLLVGESTASLGLTENEIERLTRRLDVDVTAEEDGSAAFRWRQTLQPQRPSSQRRKQQRRRALDAS